MILFNEREYVANIIETRDKPKRMGIKRLIRYLALYYYEDYKDKSIREYTDRIKQEMKLMHLYIWEYREFEYANYIKSICTKYKRGVLSPKMIECNEIAITEKEIEIIKSAQTEKEQKVLFTLYALAKVIPTPTGWVNRSISDIFQYANVNGTKKDKHNIIHSLYQQGLIELSNSLRIYGYKVDLQDDDRIAMTLTNFKNIGNQYLSQYKDGWKMCQECGRMIKIKAPNQKYCKKCSEIIQKQQIKDWKLENSGKVSDAA